MFEGKLEFDLLTFSCIQGLIKKDNQKYEGQTFYLIEPQLHLNINEIERMKKMKKAYVGIIEKGCRKCMKQGYVFFSKSRRGLKFSQNQIMIHSGVLDNKFYQN